MLETNETPTRKPCDEYWYAFLREAGETDPRDLNSSGWLPNAVREANAGSIDHGELRALLLSRYNVERMSYLCSADPVTAVLCAAHNKAKILSLDRRIEAIKSGERIVFNEFDDSSLDLPEIDRREIYLGGLRSGFMHDSVPFVEEALALVEAGVITLEDFRWAFRDGFVNRLERRVNSSTSTGFDTWWRNKRPISRLEVGKSVRYSPAGRRGGYKVPPLGHELPRPVRNEIRDRVMQTIT